MVFADVLEWVVHLTGVEVLLHYLDDFLLVGDLALEQYGAGFHLEAAKGDGSLQQPSSGGGYQCRVVQRSRTHAVAAQFVSFITAHCEIVLRAIYVYPRAT